MARDYTGYIIPLGLVGALFYFAPALKDKIGSIGGSVAEVATDTGNAYGEFAGVFENSFGILNDALKGLRDNSKMIDFDEAQQAVYDAYDKGFYEGVVGQSDQDTRTILDLRQQVYNLQKSTEAGRKIIAQNDAMREARGQLIANLVGQVSKGDISVEKFNKEVANVPAKVFIENLKVQSGYNVTSRSSNNSKSKSPVIVSKPKTTITPIKNAVSLKPEVQKVVSTNKIVKLLY